MILIAAAFAVLAVPAGAVSTAPFVRLTDMSPVTVAGRGFAKGERVTVRVAPTGQAAYAKTVKAGTTGRFTATFPARALDECSGYTLTAVGSDGTRARFREPPPPCGFDPAP